jgi:hypothetical protein
VKWQMDEVWMISEQRSDIIIYCPLVHDGPLLEINKGRGAMVVPLPFLIQSPDRTVRTRYFSPPAGWR